jgi:subtilisin family serine protease
MKLARVVLCIAVAAFGSSAYAAESDRHLVLMKGTGISKSFQSKVAALGGEITYSHDVGFAIVAGLSDDAAAQLSGHSSVQEMALDSSFELDDMVDADSAAALEATIDSPEDPAAAFFFPRQWHLRAIQADAAWGAGRLGSEDVTVAILDTGIDYTHPDLDGLVDLSRSVSFEPFDDFLTSIFFPGKHPVTDLHYHGTHVAATVASNGLAAAGVTSATTLIGVKVCSVVGGCSFGGIIGGVLHAADNGAHVANMSLGGGFFRSEFGWYVGFLNRVFNYASQQGTLVVVSAGNEAIDLDHDGNLYKTFCSTAANVCVSATGPTSGGTTGPWTDVDTLTGYSNYGRSAINVSAPGGSGPPGWVWAACSQTSLVIPICGTGTYVLGMAGTSMASPHASGVAALIAEDVGRNPARIRAILEQSADDAGWPGADPAHGKGRVNAYNAVSQ